MRRARERGMTILEVMISVAVLAIMMAMAWRTISGTQTTKTNVVVFEERNHEIRMAMRRVVADIEAAYLSRNEDPNVAQTHPRTLFVAKSGSAVGELRFSSLAHRPLWADANESEQTVISYLAHESREPGRTSETDWLRREQRRPSNENPETEAAEYDVLLTNIEKVEFAYWDWRDQDWQDTWNTTQSDGERNMLPTRVKISVTVKDAQGESVTYTTQARITMQEPLLFSQ